jgi:hypothetical protein
MWVSTSRRSPSGWNVTRCSPIGDPWRKAGKAQSPRWAGVGADRKEQPEQRHRRCPCGQPK